MAKAPAKQQQKRTYSNSSYTSYDNMLSSLSLLHSNGTVSLNVSPILPEMVGKNPERGEQMYDHESNILFFMTAEMATDLKSVIQTIRGMTEEELQGYKSFKVESRGGNYRAMTIFTPGSLVLKLAGKRVEFNDNFVLKLEQQTQDDDQPETIFHQLAVSTFTATTSDKENPEEFAEFVDVGLEMLDDMMDVVIETALGSPYHVANLASQLTINRMGSQAGGSTRRTRRGSVMEEVDGDEGNDDDGEEETTVTTRRAGSRGGRAAAASTGSSRRSGGTSRGRSLSEQFNDDDGEEETSSKNSEEESTGSTRVGRGGRRGKPLSEQFNDDDGEEGKTQDDIPV